MKFKPTKNIDTFGRWIRGLIGVLLLVYAYWQMSWIALLFALFVFFEVFTSWCALFQILGINHCPIDKKK